MADETTTASTSTPDATATTEATAIDQTTLSDTSTTDQTQSTDQKTDEEDVDKTLLTQTGDDKADDKTDDKTDADADEAGEKTGDDKADETAELFGAPEGDYTLELPEGVEVDKTALEVITPIAKRLGLSDKGLSLIAGTYAEKILPGVVDGLNDELQRNIAATHKQWADETIELVKTDKTFGGEPLPAVQQVAAKALDRFGGADFRKFLDETGLGNHPAMMKFAYLAGSAISEDTTFERGDKGSKPKSSTEKFYGS